MQAAITMSAASLAGKVQVSAKTQTAKPAKAFFGAPVATKYVSRI